MRSFAQGFLDTSYSFFAAGRESHCSIHRNTVANLAHTYRSPLLFCDLEVRTLITVVNIILGFGERAVSTQ
jgi:hypothetical protein